MAINGKTGLINGALKYPGYFWRVQKEIGSIPIHSRIHFISDERRHIEKGLYISVYRIAEYIIASDYNKKCLEAAQEAMIDISSLKPAEDPFLQLGFKNTTPPFFLGVLFDTLPEPIAVKLFWKRYAFDKKGSPLDALKNAMKTLLRFSEPLKAAPFILALAKADPKETGEIVKNMLLSASIKKYTFRRFEVKRLLMELPDTLFPGIKAEAGQLPETSFPVSAYQTIPEEKIGPKKPASPTKVGKKKKARKKKKAKRARSSNMPRYFAERQDWISQQPLETHLTAIKEHADAIKGGSRQVVLRILEIAIGTNFDPQIMAAVRETLAPITAYYRNEGDWPFKSFGFRFYDTAFYLGALFELLPRATAVKIFKMEFLRAGKLYKTTFLRIGKGLLRFSSPDEAAKFMNALKKNTKVDIGNFIQRCLRNLEICGYQFRRYEVEDVLNAYKNLTA